MDEEPLPIATYARALAHLVCHRDKPIEKVLAPLGITADQLRQADAYFNDRLAESHRLRKGVLAMMFASAFAEARKAEGLFTGDAAPAPAVSIGPSVDAPQALPSYMAAPPHAGAPAMPTPSAPIAMPAPVALPPLPAVAGPPSVAAPAPPSLVQPPPPTVATPAAGPPSAAFPQVHTAPSALLQTALPITAAGSSMKGATMPFRPASAASAPPPHASSSASESAAAPPTRPAGPGTGTAIAPSDGARLPDTPWDQAKSRVGKLTLAHYAALNVELSRNPADLTPLYQRYGLSGPDDLRHVQAAFQVQLQFDANLRAQYEALVGRMRSMSTKRDA